jgi:hypothetical protein
MDKQNSEFYMNFTASSTKSQCRKTLKLELVMEAAVLIVNFSRSQELVHLQFQPFFFLSETDAKFGDVFYCTEV